MVQKHQNSIQLTKNWYERMATKRIQIPHCVVAVLLPCHIIIVWALPCVLRSLQHSFQPTSLFTQFFEMLWVHARALRFPERRVIVKGLQFQGVCYVLVPNMEWTHCYKLSQTMWKYLEFWYTKILSLKMWFRAKCFSMLQKSFLICQIIF